MTEREIVDNWINGDLYLRDGLGEGIPSQGTAYDKMVEKQNTPYAGSAFYDESPMDPYEYAHTHDLFHKGVDCHKSIGGNQGLNFSSTGIWGRDCKMFHAKP